MPHKMNNIMEPLLAILAILVPLGLAYLILLLQSRKNDSGSCKSSAMARDDLLQKKIFRIDE